MSQILNSDEQCLDRGQQRFIRHDNTQVTIFAPLSCLIESIECCYKMWPPGVTVPLILTEDYFIPRSNILGCWAAISLRRNADTFSVECYFTHKILTNAVEDDIFSLDSRSTTCWLFEYSFCGRQDKTRHDSSRLLRRCFPFSLFYKDAVGDTLC